MPTSELLEVNPVRIHKADRWLMWSIFLYFTMNGAQLWETVLFVPAWSANPPETLYFFNGPSGIELSKFWIILHAVHEVSMVVALIYNWAFPKRRNWMLFLFCVHISLRVWTLIYFAPVILEFQNTAIGGVAHQDIIQKAKDWRNLNYLRVAVYFLVNLAFVRVLFYPRNTSSQGA